jgi:hypothetical protein
MDQTICPWCSSPIPADANACPKCGALVQGRQADIPIPGLTSVDPTARLDLPDEGAIPDSIDPLALLSVGKEEVGSPAAVEPPGEQVKLEMRKMELEAEIENAGTELMNPAGDETLDAGAPSREAVEAFKAGLLDPTGPAGETDLDALVEPWEDPEIEKRYGQ